MTRIAVTGANGFIGRHLIGELLRRGDIPVGIGRDPLPAAASQGVIKRSAGDYTDISAVTAAIEGCRCVVHLADNSQRRKASGTVHSPAHRAVVIGEAMKRAGISRLIYASSIYARPGLREDSVYGQSKLEAESELKRLSSIRPIILRLPPVYGTGCGGGHALIARAVRRGVPLPFARIDAPRSYLDVADLVALIAHLTALENEKWDQVAAAGPIEPADETPVGTATLVRKLAASQGRKALLFPFPLWLLEALGALGGLDLKALSRPLIAQDPRVVERITGWRMGK